MGDPKKAEARREHFAAVTMPAMQAVPFGQRFALAVPAVSFAVTTRESSTSYGNSYPLFLKRTTAIDYATASTFTPDEGLADNPVDDSLATCHGHMGKIVSPRGELSGMIHCGVRQSEAARCMAEIQALLGLIAQKLAKELESPATFYANYKKGESTVLDVLKKDAKGAWDGVVAMYDSAMAKEARLWSLPWREHLIERGKDVLRSNPTTAGMMWVNDNQKAIAEAVGWAKELFNAANGKSGKELVESLQQWLQEKFGKLTCAMVDALAEMAGSEKSIAEQLGEIKAIVDAEAIEIGAALLVDVALTKGRAVYATKIAPMLARGMGRAGTLFRGAVGGGSRTVATEAAGSAALKTEQAAARAGLPAQASAAKVPPSGAAKAEQAAANTAEDATQAAGRKKGDNIEGAPRNGQAPACMGCP